MIEVEVKIAGAVAGEVKPETDVEAEAQVEIVGASPGEIEDEAAAMGQGAGTLLGKGADTMLGEGTREGAGQVEGTCALKGEFVGGRKPEAGGEVEDEGKVEGAVDSEVGGEVVDEAECGVDCLQGRLVIASG